MGNDSYFSKDARFLIIRRKPNFYHLFSTVDEFKLIKILQCDFESTNFIFENQNFYIINSARRQVAYFSMLSLGHLSKKKTTDINNYRKKKSTINNLGKRKNSNFKEVVKSVDSKKQKPRVFYDEKKPIKKEKKVKHSCTGSLDLEN